MSERARRIGVNEALFRQVNERIDDVNRTFAEVTDTMRVTCECGDIACSEMFDMAANDYERMRADPLLFAVMPGHVSPDVEEVVEQREGYEVVQKDRGEPRRIAEQTDPRS